LQKKNAWNYDNKPCLDITEQANCKLSSENLENIQEIIQPSDLDAKAKAKTITQTNLPKTCYYDKIWKWWWNFIELKNWHIDVKKNKKLSSLFVEVFCFFTAFVT
jgi:hypothetical protein